MRSDAPALVVRAARADDADVLAAFNVAMAQETEGKALVPERIGRGVRKLLADSRKGFYLVGERGGRVVGQLMVTFEWSDWRDGDFWWIQSVYVLPEERRTGVYRALHREVERRAREAGACGLRLYVERENTRAQGTYERLGMTRTHYQLYELEFTLGS